MFVQVPFMQSFSQMSYRPYIGLYRSQIRRAVAERKEQEGCIVIMVIAEERANNTLCVCS